VEIRTGGGNDQVTVASFHILDDLSIDTGSGDDAVTLDPGFTEFVEDRADIITGSGNDAVLMRSSPSFTTFFQDDFSLKTGAGRDFVHVCGMGFRNRVEIDLGRGDDGPTATGDRGGLCIDGNTVFDNPNVLSEVVFRGGDGTDEYAIEFVNGIAPPGVVSDFLRTFEWQADECSFLGGTAGDCDAFASGTSSGPSTTTERSAANPTDGRSDRATLRGTEIRYTLRQDAHVQLAVYDIRGRLVRRVVDGVQPRGEHSVAWDGRDDHGSLVVSGIYLYRVATGRFAETGKLIVVR
jgi:hypothetical protein